MTVHQRGRGQLATTCQGGPAPLGFTRRWDDVTCLTCRFWPIVNAVNQFVAAMERIGVLFGARR